MNNSQRGFVGPLLLVIIAILLVGGGTYLYMHGERGNQIEISPITQATSTTQASNQTGDRKTYINNNDGFSFKYPSSWTVSHYSISDDWFEVLIRTPDDNEHSLNQIYGEKEKFMPGTGESYMCHLGLCQAPGSEELFGTLKWTHLSKPFSCAADRCPTGEVYRTSNKGWTYYLEIDAVGDAKTILTTFQFL